jgi:fused signal recognition particle receptor
MDSALFLFIGVVVLALLIGGGFALIRVRRRSEVGLEPGPGGPGVPDDVKQEVEQRRAEFLERLEAEERAGREAIGVDPEGPAKLARKRQTEPGPRPPATEGPASAAVMEPAEAEREVAEISEVDEVDEVDVAEAEIAAPVKPRFRDRLAKARSRLAGVVGSMRRGAIDDDVWDDLEEALIGADVGVEPTQELLDHLRERVKAEGMTEGAQLLDALKDEMKSRLSGYDLTLHYADTAPSVWLVVGVNGVGKTTTIGKLGKQEALAGHKVVMAAGDTFRAAAAEQLTMWADRAGAEIVRGNEGADSSSVIFDAISSAAARDADLVLADTAGRLHTKVNLMEELAKVRRVADKGDGTVSEVLLVLDATTGQNGLQQARQFTDAVDLTGVVLTKLDGSAKGGIIFAIQSQLGLPVKLVGLGETADDLVAFDADEFVEALFE